MNKENFMQWTIAMIYLILGVCLGLVYGLFFFSESGPIEQIKIITFSERHTVEEIEQGQQVLCTGDVQIVRLHCQDCSDWLKSKFGQCALVVKE